MADPCRSADPVPPAGAPRPVDPLRLRHGRGERLLGRDLADQADQDDQLRWWHNRALHQAYGIVDGLDVKIVEGVATVAPGLAYDGCGRALPLTRPRQVPVPPDAATRYLVLAAGERGVTLCWLPAAACGHGVRLATTGDGAPPLAPSLVRPLARPRIGRGATVPGSTAWQPWVEVRAEQELRLGIQVEVDTSAAGFTAPPCYFAQVTGSPWDLRLPTLPLQTLQLPLLLVPFEHVAQAGKDGFTFRLLMPWLYAFFTVDRPRSDFGEAFRGLAQITELAVTWTGIQHRRDREDGPT